MSTVTAPGSRDKLMVKLLYILNVYQRVGPFCMASLLAAKKLGIEMHLAGNWGYQDERERQEEETKYGVRIHQVDFRRNPLHPGNLRAYRQLQALQKQHHFDAIHCNTPVGGLLGRLLGKKFGIRPVIYQAHGFHFHRGARPFNWLIYYPVERLLARYTDSLVTINSEDFALAKEKMARRGGARPAYVHGVGVDLSRFAPDDGKRAAARQALGIPENAHVLLSVGELNKNKNHSVLLEALADLPETVLLIAGKGPLEGALKEQARQLNIQGRVQFLGFRRDLDALYPACDIFCLSSKREGLSTSIMEAMASGLPVVCSDIRGNRDLVRPQGGLMVQPDDAKGFSGALKQLLENPRARGDMGLFNREHAKTYGLEQVVAEMLAIYKAALGIRGREGDLNAGHT